MADISVLEVVLNGQEIGTLALLAGDRTLFAFNQTHIDDPNRPILSLSFKDSLGELITNLRPTQTRVPPFFANLLPEGPLREYLAQRAGINVQREFYLLWVLGRDLPGAVMIRPPDGDAWPPDGDHADDEHADDDRRTKALRFSLAGIQLKFSAVMEATGGLTIPVEGVGGSWIVKLPSSRFEGVPENEYAMMTLAHAVGIDASEVQLRALDEISGLPEDIYRLRGSALAVKRFDRTSGGAVHIEDFAQVFSVYPEDKYKRASYRNIAEVIWVEVGEGGIAEFVRRLVFNTLIGNTDMHLKNWSLIYPDGRNAALSPGYDFVSTIPYVADDKMALKYVRSKKMTDLTWDELSYFAAKAKLPQKLVLDSARETVERFHEAWNRERAHLPLPSSTIETIDAHVATVPLARAQTAAA